MEGRFNMSRESAVLDESLKADTGKTLDEARPRAGRIASGASALATTTVQPAIPDAKRNLRERIKHLFSKFAKALEGDHDYHNFRGM